MYPREEFGPYYCDIDVEFYELCEFCGEYVLLPCESSEEAEDCEMSED